MANADAIVVAGNGTVRVAPVGTTAPTTPTASPVAAWLDLGYVTEDGATATFDKETEDVLVWQSRYPVRTLITGESLVIAFGLREWDERTIPLALGGGTVTNPSAGVWKFVPAAAGTVDYRAFMLDWVDGDKNFRLIIPRGLATGSVETNLVRTDSAVLPIEFSALPASTSDDAYTLLSDALAFSS